MNIPTIHTPINPILNDGLETIMEYYHVDIARYLIDKNLGEYYLGYPCNNKKQLKKALSPKNNMTDNSTLIAILFNIV